MKLKFLNNNIKFNKTDVVKFNTLYQKLNPISDITGVLSKDFKKMYKYLKHKYDKSYTIIANNELETILVLKEDFIQKYIIINDLNKLLNCEYKFRRFI